MVALGIDAEPNRPLARGVLERIGSPTERENVDELAATLPDVAGDRLLFSIKEAVYKACFPQARHPLRFADAVVDIRLDGTFATRLAAGTDDNADGADPTGRWAADRGLLVSAVVVIGSPYRDARTRL
ncbi:4'-phosphopantetheinyl transferase superfamily protein [Actinomyces ruminis]|uniref:4'-phosphopantetheinyl transferase superfamily protein n=1 Tax=Actinomyces ruminis TaxID=1937003 RepID=UPI00211EC9D6|nr:4'-phosphopantetheinyl transferase superfamily protein [Actinomyces ruminis]